MKKSKITSLFSLIVLVIFGLGNNSEDLYAQTKKNRARINADYVKVIGGEHYLNIKASARIDKKTVEVAHIELSILQEVEGEEFELGNAKTNAEGIGKFMIEDFSKLQADSSGVYNLIVSFAGNESFKKASRDVSFRDAHIETEWIVRDSINYVKATLLDTQLDSAVAESALSVHVVRLFRPLIIGDEYYDTDDNGEIEVAIEDGIPGVDGNLKLEVVLKESDDYGTVISQIVAPIGTVIQDESTFDQRKMWSPRGKTPIFLLALTFSFIFVTWGIFLYLLLNLFRIVKS